MMITGATPCYPNGQQLYEVISSSLESNSSAPAAIATHPTSFLYNLSLLRDKVDQVQSLATIFLSPDHGQPPPPESTSMAVPTMTALIHEIIMTASSMMFACQQITLASPPTNNNNTATVDFSSGRAGEERGPSASASAFFSDHWYCDNYNNSKSTDDHNNSTIEGNSSAKELVLPQKNETNDVSEGLNSPNNYDIVELDAADLLAKYTHYCQVCGKGFKRDANLRMHMRAHGDEYKSSAALTNPMKNSANTNGESTRGDIQRKYSCPQEGCRWNKNHVKFQPLKSMICVKNHYKRSHCPKMYVCKRCNRKQFSVLSDLRTHEKHCGDLKWQCSCGTTFSRKDKLMGHVALFVGHSPAPVGLLTKTGNGAQNSSQMQVDQTR